MFLGVGIDLFGAFGEERERFFRHAPDLEETLAGVEVDLVAKRPQMMGEFVAVDLPRHHLLGVHRPGFEARHGGTSIPVGDVHHDHMAVEVGVKLPAGMFGEPGEQQTAGGLLDHLAVIAAAERGMLLQIGKRRADRLFMRRDDAIVAG